MALLDRINWQIETMLGETITLELFSDKCAVSPYQMCRVFHQGASMGFVASFTGGFHVDWIVGYAFAKSDSQETIHDN